ncbi:32264_t:CDS:2 [Gigaspora margarita]|uniref:32264_t:CDS:1 n=1 Tax=Gigaspora margarita TaxID=4874 RepID=A0ABN7UD66_GIGMA|nr:32264_t:CDS:2 [Gigaspora margarita]
MDGPTSDQELAKNWEKTHRNGSSINILNSTVLASGTIYGGTTNDEFFSPVFQRDQDHKNIKNNHANEKPTVTLEPFVSEELEENLLQEILVQLSISNSL